MFRIALWLVIVAVGFLQPATAQNVKLQWQDPPLDNPLRGLVPYQAAMPELPKDATAEAIEEFENELAEVFPHSVEFRYLPLRALMTGENEFDWSPVEDALSQSQARHCQSTLRVFLEYPGEPIAIPQFLIDGGLKVKRWKSDDGQIHTPDYEDEKLRAALRQFITAYGERYDGDPRIAWLTVGMLGLWGEWHNYPKEELFASKQVQGEVMYSHGKTHFQKRSLTCAIRLAKGMKNTSPTINCRLAITTTRLRLRRFQQDETGTAGFTAHCWNGREKPQWTNGGRSQSVARFGLRSGDAFSIRPAAK